jgi:hypothetical protein
MINTTRGTIVSNHDAAAIAADAAEGEYGDLLQVRDRSFHRLGSFNSRLFHLATALSGRARGRHERDRTSCRQIVKVEAQLIQRISHVYCIL